MTSSVVIELVIKDSYANDAGALIPFNFFTMSHWYIGMRYEKIDEAIDSLFISKVFRCNP